MRQADRYPALLLALFASAWVALAIAPLYRQDWLLENLLVFALLPWLALTYRRLQFSNAAYTCIFIFLVLHSIGAHYTYSLVPYDRWISWALGGSLPEWLGTQRNHYDRLIHFLYGLLMSVPASELLRRRVTFAGSWSFLLPWTFMLSHSVIYETLEWAAAAVFGGPLGTAYLGTQGDEWDSQKDMLLAAIGAALTLAVLTWRHRGREAAVDVSPATTRPQTRPE